MIGCGKGVALTLIGRGGDEASDEMLKADHAVTSFPERIYALV